MKLDYLYALENILPTKKMSRMILSLTYNCNSRCKTCNIWKTKKKDELSFNDLKKFANTPLFKKIKFLTLTGGEPFLRKDLADIVNLFKEKNPKLHITILTNALLPEIISNQVKKMPRDILITMSFNGREETHDETRGVKGNFQKLLKTIKILKDLKQTSSLIFTVTKENYDQILFAWDFAKKTNLNILISPEMNYGRLNNDGSRKLNISQQKKVLAQLKKIYSERKRFFFDDTYLFFFKQFYQNQNITNICYAGTNSVYIDYTGEIYPCENLVGKVPAFGNIKTQFKIPEDYRKIVNKTKCYKECYLLCEMIRNLRKQPIKTMLKM